jgi:predicted NAD/FAD-binding protein
MTEQQRKIAIVGAGISGLGAAWALKGAAQITIFEKEGRIGGHSHTVDVDYESVRIPVDTGFIVYNETNYPNLTALFRQLNVPAKETEMTFGFSADHGRFEWQGNTILSLFRQKRNILSLSFHRMWMDMIRFRKEGLADLKAGRTDGLSMAQYLERNRYSNAFRDKCVIPMGAAIWSSRAADMLEFPAASFIRFFENHKLFYLQKPIWRTVDGGSREYVKRLVADLGAQVRTNCAAAKIKRTPLGVEVTDTTGATERFDDVILACHSDEALGLLSDAAEPERAILGALTYAPNDVYLHRDPRLMPKRRSVWSSWNYMTETKGPRRSAPAVTYWMNALQHIDRKRPLFVSLNPPVPPRAELTFRTFNYSHPQFDAAALAAQKRLHMIQGLKRTWYCGAYAGYGFHEDGLTSGLEVALRLGGSVPWGQVAAPRVFPALAEAAE